MGQEDGDRGPGDRMVFRSPAMSEVMDTLERVARSDATVLITGESGTGKSLVARHLHRIGLRKGGPFVEISCANVPEGLLESELFGHEKGAFTGAHDRRIGKFEIAQGGTLFIDSVGDLHLPLQGKLLRVLQERVVERLSGSAPIPIDARIIASALEGLDRMISEERFRKDLFYRLNVVRIPLPPLRDRKEDIQPLAERFLEEARAEHRLEPRRFSKAALGKLQKHRWPGNLRELCNVVQRAAITSRREIIGPGEIDFSGPTGGQELLAEARDSHWTLEDLEAAHIQQILRFTRSNQTAAAKILGIHRKTLLEKRKKYGISGSGQRSEDR